MFGQEIYYKSIDERAALRNRMMGLLHQQANWVKALNVVENVALPLLIAGSSKAYAMNRAKSLLHLIGLGKFAEYKPTELSGGQQQQVSLARTLATDPPIILCDEPTGNLDSVSAKNLMDFLQILNQQSKRTLIVVTHNLEYLPYATMQIQMRDGYIIGIKYPYRNAPAKAKTTKRGNHKKKRPKATHTTRHKKRSKERIFPR